ncbi:MAG: DUF4407 domain-containing protein [bacterium]|nr:DUF4407 domain-containing protein [bacterium]
MTPFERSLKGVQDVLIKMFGLATYGDSLRTRVVNSYMTRVAVVLILMLIVDGWAWIALWGIALAGGIAARLIGMAFAGGIVTVDVGIATTDTSESRSVMKPMLGRFLIIFIGSLLTAVPTELRVFDAEIETRINMEEAAAVNKIRQAAIDDESAKFDKLIADDQTRIDGLTAGTLDQAQKDVDELQAQRNTTRAAFADDLTKKEDIVRMEAAGKGPSGRYGTGEAYKAMQQQAKEARSALDTFDAETQTLIADLRAKRETKRGDEETKSTTAIATLRTEKDTKITSLRLLEPELLAKQYGHLMVEKKGNQLVYFEWKRDHGLLSRIKELHEMMSEDSTVTGIVWGCRLVMMLFGLIVVFLKITCPEEVKIYYSVRAQAAAGHEGARAALKAKGYEDRDDVRKYVGLLPEVRDLMEETYTRIRALAKAYEDFVTQKVTLARSMEQLPLTAAQIQNRLHQFWIDNVQLALFDLEEVTERCILHGIGVPTWPKALCQGVDPRTLQEPWKVTKDELLALDWTDPAPLIREVKDGESSLRGFFEQMEQHLLALEERLMRFITAHPGISRQQMRAELEPERQNYWRTNMVPIIREIAKVDDAVAKTGAPTLRRPTILHGRVNVETCWRLPDDEALRTYGWDPNYRPPTPEPVVMLDASGNGDPAVHHVPTTPAAAPAPATGLPRGIPGRGATRSERRAAASNPTSGSDPTSTT